MQRQRPGARLVSATPGRRYPPPTVESVEVDRDAVVLGISLSRPAEGARPAPPERFTRSSRSTTTRSSRYAATPTVRARSPVAASPQEKLRRSRFCHDGWTQGVYLGRVRRRGSPFRVCRDTVGTGFAGGAIPAAWRHGYLLAKQTGLQSGSVVPILIRLAERGLARGVLGGCNSPPGARGGTLTGLQLRWPGRGQGGTSCSGPGAAPVGVAAVAGAGDRTVGAGGGVMDRFARGAGRATGLARPDCFRPAAATGREAVLAEAGEVRAGRRGWRGWAGAVAGGARGRDEQGHPGAGVRGRGGGPGLDRLAGRFVEFGHTCEPDVRRRHGGAAGRAAVAGPPGFGPVRSGWAPRAARVGGYAMVLALIAAKAVKDRLGSKLGAYFPVILPGVGPADLAAAGHRRLCGRALILTSQQRVRLARWILPAAIGFGAVTAGGAVPARASRRQRRPRLAGH